MGALKYLTFVSQINVMRPKKIKPKKLYKMIKFILKSGDQMVQSISSIGCITDHESSSKGDVGSFLLLDKIQIDWMSHLREKREVWVGVQNGTCWGQRSTGERGR